MLLNCGEIIYFADFGDACSHPETIRVDTQVNLFQ